MFYNPCRLVKKIGFINLILFIKHGIFMCRGPPRARVMPDGALTSSYQLYSTGIKIMHHCRCAKWAHFAVQIRHAVPSAQTAEMR